MFKAVLIPVVMFLVQWGATACASTGNDDSPAGVWESYDERTGLLRAVIRIRDLGGTFVGAIEQVFRLPGDKDEDAVCRRCPDGLKDRPIKGLTILTGLRKQGASYDDGEILDPANGVIYRCRAELTDNGRMLEVRGFIGFSLFGRTQVWRRRLE